MSDIKKDIKNIEQYINLVLDKGYCDCNELNVISTGKYCDGSKNVAYSMQNILAERKQDKQKIKELEEENYVQKVALLENSIPKQKVKDKIEKLRNDIKLGNCRYPYVEEHKIDILQELLGGDEKK